MVFSSQNGQISSSYYIIWVLLWPVFLTYIFLNQSERHQTLISEDHQMVTILKMASLTHQTIIWAINQTI